VSISRLLLRRAAGLGTAFLLGAASVQAPAAQGDPERDSWYIGFALGGGPSPNYTSGGESRSFDQWFGGASHGVPLFVNFKVGATLNERSLLGFDATGMGQLTEEGVSPTGQIQISNAFAVFTYFPQRRGLFLRGGGGLSELMMEVGGFSSHTTGYGVLGGVGYAFWLGRSFNLTLGLDHSRQFYSSSEVARSHFTALYLGFDWY